MVRTGPGRVRRWLAWLAPRRRLRRWAAGLSLRTRLVVAITALMAVIFMGVGLVSLGLLQHELTDQLDQQLEAVSARAASQYDRQGSHYHGQDFVENFLDSKSQTFGTLSALIVDGRVSQAGVLDWNSKDGEPTVFQLHGVDDSLLDLQPDNHHHYRPIGRFGEYRVMAAYSSDHHTLLISGLSLGDQNSIVSRLGRIDLAVALAGLALAGIASAVIVRLNLRPLRRVAATASRVAQLRLDRGKVALPDRVPPEDTDPRTEVGQVGAALNKMIEHVAAALAARQASETQVRQFLADASHELRTPLAAIRGYAELAGRGGEALSPDITHVLRRISSQAERMTSLVEDMLLLARLDAGRPLARDRVDVSQLVVDAVSDAHAAGPQHKWTLSLPDEAVMVTGDALRLAQVLANLMTNARVHTPPGTTVRAELTRRSGQVVLTVLDNGPGIPPALLPHVFGRFARGDSSRSRAAGSTGLGLAIVAAVVAAHGGVIEAESVPGRTAFTVRLPAADPGSDSPPQPRPDKTMLALPAPPPVDATPRVALPITQPIPVARSIPDARRPTPRPRVR
ncbi:MAG: HAMP domain-containing protein [Pseudonocardia sp.]|nr:HAMP domain-containing protein [Pseudonocardia sp.]